MADIADQAADREDEIRAAALASVPKAPVLLARGFCLNPNCEMPFHGHDADTRRFCGAPCRDEYEREQKKKAVSGRR